MWYKKAYTFNKEGLILLQGILFNYVQVDIKNHRSRGARFNILLFDDNQGDINTFKNSLNYLISLIKN